jgi:hypothetical protein
LVEVHYLALATISNFSDQTSALLTEVFTEVFQESGLQSGQNIKSVDAMTSQKI